MSPILDRDPRKSISRIVAFAVPFSWVLKTENFEKSLDAVITNIKRIPPNSIDPTIKNYHWFDFISGMFEVYGRGHEVGILIDENQKIHGGPGLNIFSLKGDVLHTPEICVLKDVTRGCFKVLPKS